MKHRTKLWTGISAAALIAAGGAFTIMSKDKSSHEGEVAASGISDEAQAPAISAEANVAPAAAPATHVPATGEGEGGEGNINVARAAKDPVVFLSALDIIRAHYLAGEAMLDVEGGRGAAGEMFAHPISEVYVDMEGVFEAQGVRPFMDEMSAAVELALGDAPEADVHAAAAKVYAALDEAETKAPQSDRSARAIAAALTADMFDRAAKQYEAALSPTGTDEAWIDGYGFWKTAEKRAADLLESLGDEHEGLAEELRAGQALFTSAYPSVEKPDEAPVGQDRLYAVGSRIMLKAMPL